MATNFISKAYRRYTITDSSAKVGEGGRWNLMVHREAEVETQLHKLHSNCSKKKAFKILTPNESALIWAVAQIMSVLPDKFPTKFGF